MVVLPNDCPPEDTSTLAPAIGLLLLASVTVPDRVPLGPAVQFGNLKFPIRVCQLNELVVW